jgi:general secretion pathway protein A
MFLEYYGLREQPFGVTPDPRYLYWTPTHREALASLFYGIQAGCGFMALIAKPGMGKTTLLYQLHDRLGAGARTVFLTQTQCDSREFIAYLLADLGLDGAQRDLVTLHTRLNEVLVAEMQAGKRFVLIIDESQDLDDAVLETIRLLSNFETPQRKLLQIILAGQPQLAAKLARPGLAQLRQRISIVSRLTPLNAEDTGLYIYYRLLIAGYRGGAIFTREARDLIAEASEGIPRKVNNICFNALSLGCAVERKTIDSAIVREVLADLDLGEMTLSAGPNLLAFSDDAVALQAASTGLHDASSVTDVPCIAS